MVFSSLTFLCVFLPAVVVLHTIFRNMKIRNGILLVFSLLFYAWGEPVWIIGMIFTTVVNYICSLAITRSENAVKRKFILLTATAVSLVFLMYFKYTAFAVNSITGLFGLEFSMPAQRLPIGISFYTFQAITYTVDVYRGNAQAQKNPLLALLYICFFPQLVAGPIIRYSHVAEKLSCRTASADDIFNGFIRFIIGLSKKVLLANLCGEAINLLPAAGGDLPLSFLGSWVLIILFAFQIYFDFSGYSDMAIGMARMFGFRYLENFDYPYISRSISEFWRRWHISLGAFFRDYVYIPLGGNRTSTRRLVLNLMIVWMLTGLWHGANWNYVIWGAYFGVLIIAERLIPEHVLGKIPGFLKNILTMVLVLVGWSLFYYENLAEGLYHIGAMFGLGGSGVIDAATVYTLKNNAVMMVVSALCCLPWIKWIKASDGLIDTALGKTTLLVLRPAFACLLLLFSMLFLVGQSFNPFLYFRF